ncbi:hypothetical protein T07_773 [Trichinella nelsoni]|uniref:Uncharacterized protein n=1 Tax=Trichinella nelsoni TaxID=6336 RepID=A0A0V0S424_9BILA|nr:hypothetical protein T07_773 [Trichinella nelsoni]
MAGSFFFQWKINGRKRHRNQLSLAEMFNVDKWSVQVERPLQLSVSDGLVKKRARLLALWFCFVTSVRCSAHETTKPAVGGVWSIRMETYSEKRLCILIGPLATAMNAKVRLAPAVLFACSTCASLVRRSLPSPTQWDIVDIAGLLWRWSIFIFCLGLYKLIEPNARISGAYRHLDFRGRGTHDLLNLAFAAAASAKLSCLFTLFPHGLAWECRTFIRRQFLRDPAPSSSMTLLQGICGQCCHHLMAVGCLVEEMDHFLHCVMNTMVMEHNVKLIFPCSSKRLNDFSSELLALNLPQLLQLQFLKEFHLSHFLCACSAYNSLEILLLTSSLYGTGKTL